MGAGEEESVGCESNNSHCYQHVTSDDTIFLLCYGWRSRGFQVTESYMLVMLDVVSSVTISSLSDVFLWLQ